MECKGCGNTGVTVGVACEYCGTVAEDNWFVRVWKYWANVKANLKGNNVVISDGSNNKVSQSGTNNVAVVKGSNNVVIQQTNNGIGDNITGNKITIENSDGAKIIQ